MGKGHIVVDILLTRLPQRIQSYFQIFTLVLGLGTWVWISFASIIFANRQWRLGEKTELLDIPIAPIRYIWIIALVVLCLLILIQIIEAISEVSNKWNRL